MNKINTDSSLRRIQFIGYASLLVAGLGIYYWGTQSSLNGAVVASATVVSDTYSKRVQHREGGIVAEIKVKNGDQVREGQELVILDPTETSSEVNVIQSSLDEFIVRQLRLEAQRDGNRDFKLPKSMGARLNDPSFVELVESQKRLLKSTLDGFSKREEQLQKQIVQLEEQLTGVRAQRASREKTLIVTKREFEDQQELLRDGLATKSKVNEVERNLNAIEGEIGQLTSQIASGETRIGEVKLQILQGQDDERTQALTELRDVDTRVSELRERQVAAGSRLNRMSVKAPITGTVYELAVNTVGGVIQPGEVLMLVAPEGEDLVLQAQISPNDVDQVRKGQEARVRFTAFNSRETPEIRAEVAQVAADTTRQDANSLPFYAVRLTISADEVNKLGDKQLRPGMMAETFITTEARSPLTYLLKPLYDILPRAMRES